MIQINFWLIFGFTAQAVFFTRFLIQWIASEKRKESYIPLAFWYLSLFGGVGILIYSIHIKDPVFILGQSAGVLIYIRNLIFIYQKNGKNKSKN